MGGHRDDLLAQDRARLVDGACRHRSAAAALCACAGRRHGGVARGRRPAGEGRAGRGAVSPWIVDPPELSAPSAPPVRCTTPLSILFPVAPPLTYTLILPV